VNVPECLSAHVSDARPCTGPVAALVNRVGMRGERAAVEAAGGWYVVTAWICTATTCAVIVRNLLVWRDYNHLSTTYPRPRWLAPLVAETLVATGS
jgi:hypothetical protein